MSEKAKKLDALARTGRMADVQGLIQQGITLNELLPPEDLWMPTASEEALTQSVQGASGGAMQTMLDGLKQDQPEAIPFAQYIGRAYGGGTEEAATGAIAVLVMFWNALKLEAVLHHNEERKGSA